MIFKIEDDTFFGQLPNRTTGSMTKWGILFTADSYLFTVEKEDWLDDPCGSEGLDQSRRLLNTHIKDIGDEYSRLGEIFQLIGSQGNSAVIEQAHPRTAQVFLASTSDAVTAENIYRKVAPVDQSFTHMELLIDGRISAVQQDKSLRLVEPKMVQSTICNYLTSKLAILERLQSLVQSTRRDEESI